MSRAIDVLVADSDAAIASQLCAALRTRYAVAPPVTDLGQLGAALARYKPRALLVGMNWPDTILSRFGELFSTNVGLRICVLSPQLAASAVTQALAAGARGFLGIPARTGGLTAAVASILAGEVYIPVEMWRADGGDAEMSTTPSTRSAIIVHEPDSPEYARSVAWISRDRPVTPRQAEASLGVRDGFGEKEIAVRMGCSTENVHALLDEIRKRLAVFGVRNGASLSAVIEMSLAAMPRDWQPE